MNAKIVTFSSHGDTTLLEYDPATADMDEVNKVSLAYWYGARLQRHVTRCYAEENNNSPPTGWPVGLVLDGHCF